MTRSTMGLSLAGALALGAAVVILLQGQRRPARASDSGYADRFPPPTPAGIVSEAEPIESPPPRGAAAEPAKEATDAQQDERSILAELHRLGEGSPELSLQLARAGNERFPGSADAPERSWFVVKSLVNMQRFDEAKAEAITMLARYPDTSWSADVQRHLLVNPLYPAEAAAR